MGEKPHRWFIARSRCLKIHTVPSASRKLEDPACSNVLENGSPDHQHADRCQCKRRRTTPDIQTDPSHRRDYAGSRGRPTSGDIGILKWVFGCVEASGAEYLRAVRSCRVRSGASCRAAVRAEPNEVRRYRH